MARTLSRLIIGAAAASIAVAPVAVQANTRAGDRATTYSIASSKPGVGRSEDGERLAGGFSIVIALLAAAGLGGVVLGLAGSDQSPGT